MNAHAPRNNARGHFARFNALVDGGFVASLGKRELKVWLALERHANNETGQTFVSLQTLADETGMNQRNVRRAVEHLEALRLVEAERPGGGRKPGGNGLTTVRRMKVPNTGAHCAPVQEENGGAGERDTGAQIDENGGADNTNTGAQCAPPTSHRTSMNISSNISGSAVMDGMRLELMEELRAAGVKGKVVEDFATLDELTPIGVRLLRHELKQEKGLDRNPAGWIVAQINQGKFARGLIAPKAVADLADQGEIRAVGGRTLNDVKVGQNANGLYFDGTLAIRKEDLQCASIRLAPMRQQEGRGER